MERIISVVVRLIQSGQRAYARKWSFSGVFVLLFAGSVVALAELDLLPSAPVRDEPVVSTTYEARTPVREDPLRIEIPALDRAVSVQNPTTTDITLLNKELLKGAVRHPLSAKLGEAGNVVLFGHSSYLPVVGNQSYKAFNGIQKLAPGDIIMIYSSASAYVYSVKSVSKMNAAVDGIPLSSAGKVLTLSTCDSFGGIEDRWVVTAELVESRPVSTLG